MVPQGQSPQELMVVLVAVHLFSSRVAVTNYYEEQAEVPVELEVLEEKILVPPVLEGLEEQHIL